MDWRIVTPEKTAIFMNGKLSFAAGQAKPALPDDASEALWLTYFRSIFNPARLKVQAMTSEMPKKYWKNLPEAAAIPDLIANAPARARAMAEAAPTLPPVHAERARQQLAAHKSSWEGPKEALPAAIHDCTRCPLHLTATQAVPGAGPVDAALMIVGEQPGDQEDLAGLPFVGPAGQLFDKVAQSAGLNRAEAFITNAVKHFKFTPRGKRRLHQRPSSSEIEHCRWWLDAERALVKPKLILALGATAAEALTGSGARHSAALRHGGTACRRNAGAASGASFVPAAPARSGRAGETGGPVRGGSSPRGGDGCGACGPDRQAGQGGGLNRINLLTDHSAANLPCQATTSAETALSARAASFGSSRT
jgi:uracil-DNA glycosylase family protein